MSATETQKKVEGRKPKSKPPSQIRGPSSLTGTPEARRAATAILEVLAGLRRPLEASESLGISLPRYYVLETRALQGILHALEPVPRGPKERPGTVIARLEREKKRLQTELARAQTLVRMAQRSIGITPVDWSRKPAKPRPGKKRSRKPEARAGRFVAALKKPVLATEEKTTVPPEPPAMNG